MKLFSTSHTTMIHLPKGAPESVVLAAQDLRRDLLRLAGRADGFEILADGAPCGIFVRIGSLAGEAYTVDVTESQIAVTGGDSLGAVYGIYAISTKLLGVDPMHRVNGRFPAVRDSLEIPACRIVSPERKVRFRGWFLNDEDLLTEFKAGGGVRDIDYPFYSQVMHPDVLDMVLESALRCEINLMIPSSFVDITNKAEEELVRRTVSRGLFITQHHVEPMGVSYFGADNYLKRNRLSGEVSFITNRDRMLEIWRHFAEKWAVYGDRVIWQLGLRGKADQAVWQSDGSISASPADRGGIISDAVRAQYEIVKSVLGHNNFESTATLWMEGAALFDAGYLTLPERTVVIFSDVGCSQTFGSDFYRSKRHPGRKYGIYYHAAYYHTGPHLAEGCDPKKMLDSYRDAEKYGSLYYSILNVSNLREVHFLALLNAKIMERGAADLPLISLENELLGEVFADARRRYFDAIGDLGDEALREFCEKHNFHYFDHRGKNFPVYPMTDGVIRWMGLDAMGGKLPVSLYEKLAPMEERFASLLADFETLSDTLSPEDCNYFDIFIKLQTRYMMLLARWARLVYEKDFAGALAALDGILEARKVAEHGEFSGWYTGDGKIGIEALRSRTLAKL